MAVKALATAALPAAAVRGFDADTAHPQSVPVGGCVIGHPGSPGDPAGIDLGGSGPVYHFEHDLDVEMLPGLADADPSAALDGMMQALSDAVLSDRTLGGLVDWLEISGGDEQDLRLEGSASARWARVTLTGSYSASSPLGD